MTNQFNVCRGNHRLDSDEDFQCLFDDLSTELPSFVRKEGSVKSKRWFSLNEAIYVQKSEFWPLKMLLKHHNKTPDIVDEKFEDPCDVVKNIKKRELDLLKSQMGGLKVAEVMICSVPWKVNMFKYKAC